MIAPPVLNVNGLTIVDNRYPQTLVNAVSFGVAAQHCTAIVGESGSGKSLVCKSLLGLQSPWLSVSGEVMFNQQNLLTLTAKQWQQVRGAQIGLILQDAMSAFDPLFTVGQHLAETLACHAALSPAMQIARSKALLTEVKLRNVDMLLKLYPNQLSGGMLQRVMMALALATQPSLIIADEPTTALDAITQYEIICQFAHLRTEKRTALLFVSHDLALVRELAQHVVVMKAGQIVEQGATEQIFTAPEKDYTRYLLETRRRLSRRFNQVMRRTNGVA